MHHQCYNLLICWSNSSSTSLILLQYATLFSDFIFRAETRLGLIELMCMDKFLLKVSNFEVIFVFVFYWRCGKFRNLMGLNVIILF